MFKYYAKSLIVAAALTWSGAAAADQIFIAGNAGLNLVADAEFDYGGFAPTVTFEPGYAASVEAGYIIKDRFRISLEVSRRQNDFDQMEFTSGVAEMGGDITALAVMGNFAYEFKNKSMATPYAGGGIGLVDISINDASFISTGVRIVDDSTTAFAVQFVGGVALNVAPSFDITFDLRFLTAFDLEFTDVFGDTFATDYAAASLNAGVRFRF